MEIWTEINILWNVLNFKDHFPHNLPTLEVETSTTSQPNLPEEKYKSYVLVINTLRRIL